MKLHLKFTSTITAVVVLVALTLSVCSAAVIRVKTTGNDSRNGANWNQAKRTVQAAIDAASSGDEIWVASGTYSQSITLKNGVDLYGGFAGTENSRSQRNWSINVTTLSGNYTASTVTAPSGADTTVDGFTITGGGGTEIDYAYYGGGVYSSGADLTLANDNITNNWMSYSSNGGGVYCTGGSLTVTDSEVSSNGATNGGGISCSNCDVVVAGSEITSNGAYVVEHYDGYGGGIVCSGGTAEITRNMVSGNTSRMGGGIWVACTSAVVSNNVVVGNDAWQEGGDWGGGILVDGGAVSVTGNTVVGNWAGTCGGGVALWSGTVTVASNIIASNSSGIYNYSATVTLRNNDVYGNNGVDYEGLQAGQQDISSDPLFAADGYHLTSSSPCKDAGWNSAPGMTSVDIDGQNRIYNSTVDIGADEYQP